jgi:hypothetical protein
MNKASPTARSSASSERRKWVAAIALSELAMGCS